ncbi:hypothetical protein [Cupriavidus sp.]|uniref:hypothetical protein n=1 Tax=Cupriavidus sp. TaxID=1873897 RepID=UPI003D0E2920
MAEMTTRVPREWLAAITSPARGVMDMTPGAWRHSPADVERVMVREILPGEQPAAITRATGASIDVAQAVEAAMTELARELGCFYSDLIPHNSGLFIPSEGKACHSAVDAIRRLFAHVHAGGAVHRPAAGDEATKAGRGAKAAADIYTDPRQVGLF